MKFEDAIEKINDLFFEPCVPGYSSGDFAPEFFGQIEDLEEIIEELQETYAPKIKMTQRESDMLKRLKRVPQTDVGVVDYSRPEPKVLLSNESKFVDAWLHPELIEEVENDI